jgi:phosphoglycolate phosphatase
MDSVTMAAINLNSMNKGFIFDWSGTLSDNFHCFCKVCDLIFKELERKPISVDEVRLNFTLPYMRFWNRYFPDLTQKRQNELYNKFIHQTPDPELFEGVRETISHIHKAGFKLFIVSSDPVSKLVPETLKSGFSELLTEVVGEIHEKKDAIHSLIQSFNLDPRISYYAGDTSGDIEAGKAAGVKTVGISWGFQHKTVLAKSNPDFLINDILEIMKIV